MKNKTVVRIPTKPRLVSGRFSKLRQLAEKERETTIAELEHRARFERKQERQAEESARQANRDTKSASQNRRKTDAKTPRRPFKELLREAKTAFVSVPETDRSPELMAEVDWRLPHLALDYFQRDRGDQEKWKFDIGAYLGRYDALIVVSGPDSEISGGQVWEIVTAIKLGKLLIVFDAARSWYSPYVGFQRFDEDGNPIERWQKGKAASYKLRQRQPRQEPLEAA
jgi:hypothetical protein